MNDRKFGVLSVNSDEFCVIKNFASSFHSKSGSMAFNSDTQKFIILFDNTKVFAPLSSENLDATTQNLVFPAKIYFSAFFAILKETWRLISADTMRQAYFMWH